MLSNTCKYAIRSVLYIAVNQKDNEKIGIKKIAKDLDLPAPFLSKILQVLSKNKILKSTKGPNGGFALNKNAKDLNLLSIIKIIDGTDFFDTCVIGVKLCEDKPDKKELCPFHDHLDPLKEGFYSKFKNLTVGDFKDGITELEGDILF